MEVLHLLRGQLDGFEYLHVPGASAEVATKRLFDFGTVRIGVFLQQRLGDEENSRRAVAALRCAEVGERRLQGMKPAGFGHTFDGRDVLAFEFGRQEQAGKSRLPVDQHGAGSAFADLAAVLRAEETEVFAQDLQQRPARNRCDLPCFTVDRESQELFRPQI